LDARAFRRTHPGVVIVGVYACALEARRQLFTLLTRGAVDNPRRRRVPDKAEDQGQLVFLAFGRQNTIGEVRPVEAGYHDLGLAHPQGTQDILPHAWCCGRREGEDRRIAEIPHNPRQKEVVRPKIVPPLGDAVGLVHHEEAHAGPAQSQDEL
jgi:hypothetical protein